MNEEIKSIAEISDSDRKSVESDLEEALGNEIMELEKRQIKMTGIDGGRPGERKGRMDSPLQKSKAYDNDNKVQTLLKKSFAMNNELNDILSDPNMSYDFGGINPECQFYDNLLKNYCVEVWLFCFIIKLQILINLKVVNETLDEFIADSTSNFLFLKKRKTRRNSGDCQDFTRKPQANCIKV